MNHGNEVFRFIKDKKTKKVIEVESLTFCFELQEVLKKRFGEEKLKEFYLTGNLIVDVDLKEVEEDFPQLLNLEGNKINWKIQDYNEIARVYYFFLEYKQNVKLRALKSETETLSSKLMELQSLIASTQINFSPQKS